LAPLALSRSRVSIHHHHQRGLLPALCPLLIRNASHPPKLKVPSRSSPLNHQTTTTAAAMPRQPKNKAVEAPKPVVPAPAAVAPAAPKPHPVIDVDNFIRVRDSVSKASPQVLASPPASHPVAAQPCPIPAFQSRVTPPPLPPAFAAPKVPKHAMPTPPSHPTHNKPPLHYPLRRVVAATTPNTALQASHAAVRANAAVLSPFSKVLRVM